MNNPLVYTDPDGEFFWIAVGVGALIGSYLGGSAAEGWEFNPGNWAWDGDTWAGIGLGAVFGAAGGAGFAYAAPAVATALGPTGAGFSALSANVAGYTITGGVAGGAIGYTSGFSGGMLYSDGNLKYSHQSGMFGAQIGATVGSALGAATGLLTPEGREWITGMFSGPPSIDLPLPKSNWDGPYFQGTEEEANNLLLSSSKMFNVETSYWNTSRGFYFEPIKGNALGIEYNLMTYDVLDYNAKRGFKTNTISSAYRYTYLEMINESAYLSPNIFQRSRIYNVAHAHPRSSEPGGNDLLISYLLKIRGMVVGWNGLIYRYGGHGYW